MIIHMSTSLANPWQSDVSGDISFVRSGSSQVGLKKSYKIVLKKDEDGRLVARCPDLQGVVTDGANLEEVQRNAMEAIAAIIEARGLNKEYILTFEHQVGV
jgi:predicted RNase H-like HicB family nuclease